VVSQAFRELSLGTPPGTYGAWLTLVVGAAVGSAGVRVMDVRLLGDVEVRDADGSLVGLGSRQRAVLTVLLYRANAVVARSEIVRFGVGAVRAEPGRAGGR